MPTPKRPRKLPESRTIADVWRAIADENLLCLPQVESAFNSLHDVRLDTGLCKLVKDLYRAGVLVYHEREEMKRQVEALFYDPDRLFGGVGGYLWPSHLYRDLHPGETDGPRWVAAGLLALYAEGEIDLTPNDPDPRC